MPKLKLDILKEIVNKGKGQTVVYTIPHAHKQRRLIIDVYTASVMLQLYNTLSEEHQRTFLAMPWHLMQSKAFEIKFKQEQRITKARIKVYDNNTL